MHNAIQTKHIYPPIPTRKYDWEAARMNWDEGDPIGYGATEKEAIDDLISQEKDRDDAVLYVECGCESSNVDGTDMRCMSCGAIVDGEEYTAEELEKLS